jgi:hypothetical protein
MNGWIVARRGLATATVMTLLSLAPALPSSTRPLRSLNCPTNATSGSANAVLYGDPSKRVSISYWSSGMRAI